MGFLQGPLVLNPRPLCSYLGGTGCVRGTPFPQGEGKAGCSVLDTIAGDNCHCVVSVTDCALRSLCTCMWVHLDPLLPKGNAPHVPHKACCSQAILSGWF